MVTDFPNATPKIQSNGQSICQGVVAVLATWRLRLSTSVESIGILLAMHCNSPDSSKLIARMLPSRFFPLGILLMKPRLAGTRAGFTLVEVTMAIGIIAFAFIGIFQLLPIGLGVSRQAIDTTIETQIAQQMKTQALQTDFSLLSKLSELETACFDDQGRPTEKSKAVYAAKFLVSNTTALAPGVQSARLATVTVHVQRSSDGNMSESQAKKFPILIPDNGL